MHVFTYGTLMYSEVWHAVIGRRYRQSNAIVGGFERRAVKGAAFPCLIPVDDLQARVSGILYFGVADEDLETLDEFEADQYDRGIVMCELPGGESVEAFAYIWSARHAHLIGDQWDEEWFRKEGLRQFLARHGA